MTIIPITQTEPACFGVLCSHHEHCARYHAAEGTPVATIDTCEEPGGVKPLFVAVERQARVVA